jgi:3-oxoacyl-[acyl-carrier-protein] synthase-3
MRSVAYAVNDGRSHVRATTAPVRLLGLGAYLPDRVMTNRDWCALVDTSDDWIVSRTGIRRRRIAADRESTADLAVAAARSALDAVGLSADALDEIIVATDTPEVYVPDTACFVQHRIGARAVPAYTLGGSGCAGFLQGLDIARSRIQCGAGPVLVVGVELLTRVISWRDRQSCVLFGDAAAAAIVGPGPKHADSAAEIAADIIGDIVAADIVDIVSGTDGSRAGLLGIDVGGTRHPFTLDAARADLHRRVTMDGRLVFKEAVTRMTQAARDVLAKAGAVLDDVALVVPHQANLRIIEAVAKALPVPMDRVFVHVQDYGNTGSASLPLALWDARSQGRIARGDLVLATSFGAGFRWAAALFQF